MAKIIQGKFPAPPKKKIVAIKEKAPAAAYQLKISLLYSKPSIWRRVLVPATMKLSRLHEVIQLSMGWTDTHLHQFLIGNNFYGPPDQDNDWGEEKTLNEKKFKLCDLEAAIGKRCMYDYDFGDNWQHKIKLEKVVPAEEKPPAHPVLLAGKRACPPEDIGGIPGYEDFLEAIGDPAHEAHEEMLEWYGGDDFDADFLDMKEINRLLNKVFDAKIVEAWGLR